MDQVLYSKYNSLRRPAFRIVTEIREKDGKKYVVKRAGESAAERHLSCIEENRKLLSGLYDEISVIPAEKTDKGLVFPYVTGRSLKDELVEDYTGRVQFIRETAKKLDIILAFRPECLQPFIPTEAFTKVFGGKVPAGGDAVCPANVDALFTNFMDNGKALYCIDYEWVVNFPVPIGFLRYRALRYLHYELEHSLLDGMSLADFLALFEIGPDNQAVYEKMEYNFQFHVHGENLKYHYLNRYQKAHEVPQDTICRLESAMSDQNHHIYNLEQIINNKETNINNLEQTIRDRETNINDLEHAIKDKDNHIGNLDQIIHNRENHIQTLSNQLHDVEGQREALERAYLDISNAFFWRITKPMRVTVIKIRELAQRNKHIYQGLRLIKKTLRQGPRQVIAAQKALNKHPTLEFWPITEEYEKQRQTTFSRDIKFSILVPLYNTPTKYLTDMVDSVMIQTYENWELCMADGSDDKHRDVKKTCKKLTKRDHRIKYRKLEKNLGISGNTNACIEMATGDYIALFDHDDLLHPSALYEYMKIICEQDADFIYSDENTFHDTPEDAFQPHFKPDFAPDTLRANNYICHFTVFKRDLLEKAGGGFRSVFDGSQDFDMVLRLTEQAKCIVHVPKVLYYWRAHKGSVAESVSAKPYVIDAAKRAIGEHLKRVGLEGEALDSIVPSMYRLKYTIHGTPLISILIPNKDHADDLRRCVDSIREKSTWLNWEIIVIENNSTEKETFAYYEELRRDERICVVTWDGGFNYSAINNFGFRFAKGEHILLLNNDTEVIAPDWLQEMLMYSQRDDVGAVGAKLYYPDHTIQHAGLGIGLLTLAGHYHRNFPGDHPGYMGRLIYAQDLSGVTAACMMIPRHVYEEMNGLDETFEVAFNDVDLCMRIRQAGYLIVFTPFAELTHYESKSRGTDEAPEKRARFVGEVTRFQEKWKKELEAGDPYFNPNFSLDKEDFSVKA